MFAVYRAEDDPKTGVDILIASCVSDEVGCSVSPANVHWEACTEGMSIYSCSGKDENGNPFVAEVKKEGTLIWVSFINWD